MDCRIWNPTITRSAIVDSYTEPSGLVYVSNSTLEYWQGRWWAAMDGTADGLVEGSSGQQCWMTTSTDGTTWTPAYQPFRDSDYAENPVTDGGLDWQPNLVVVGEELWCTWSGENTWLSRLTSPTGKWINERIEFNGLEVRTSTDFSTPTDGWSLRASFDGVSDWLFYPSQNPIVLANGDVAAPGTFSSLTTVSEQSGSTNLFIRLVKHNAMLRYVAAQAEWQVTLIDTSDFGDFGAWEPFFVQNPAGHIYAYTRNLDGGADNADMLLVAVSTDGGRTFSPSVSTELEWTSNRAFAKRISDRRWVMVATDTPQGGTPAPQRGVFGSRINGQIAISRRGSNDFINGITFSDSDPAVNYPQCTIAGDTLAINYTSGVGNGIRRSMQLVRVSPLPSDDYAYIHARTVWYDADPTAPELVTGSPDYYEFSSRHQIVSQTSVPQGDVTFTAWAEWGYGGILIDSRDTVSPRFGLIFTVGGLLMGELNFLHGENVPPGGGPVFVAASVAPTSVTVYVGDGGTELTSATFQYRTIDISGNPADGDTLSVNGNTYTFKTSPSASRDVQIGEDITETVFNLRPILKEDGVATAQFLSATDGVITSGVLAMTLGSTSPQLEENVQGGGTVFAVSESSSQISVGSGIALTPGAASVGYSAIAGSALTPFDGKLYEANVWDSALTEPNIIDVYNNRAADFGYSAISGASAPAAALLNLNAENPDNVEWPPLTNDIVGYCTIVDDDTLDIFGEGSASLELPYGASEVTLEWKLGATPSGDDQYVVATFGTKDRPARLYISGDEPTKLYLNDRLISTIATPTNWQTTTVIVSTDKVTIGDLSYYAPGKPRCFLGNAYPEGLLASTKSVRYDVSLMSVIEPEAGS